jgi:putative colanic acid biosynthesis UDP-glucose lipid carrier transferase
MTFKGNLPNRIDSSIYLFTRFSDILATLLSAFIMFKIRFGTFDMAERYTWALVITLLLAFVILPHMDIYESWRSRGRLRFIAKVFVAFAVVGAVLAIVAFLTGMGRDFSRIWVVGTIIGAAILSVVFRLIVDQFLRTSGSGGNNRQSVLLIGDSQSCFNAYVQLQNNSSAVLEVKRVLLVDYENNQQKFDCPCLSYVSGDQISHNEDEVWICLPFTAGPLVRDIQLALGLSTANIRYVPDMTGFSLINHKVSRISNMYLLDLSCTPMSGVNRFIKAIEDRVLAGIILFLISPIMIVIAILVKLSSAGPIFYRQERVSWNGKSFNMLKFRSMPTDSEKEGLVWGGASAKKTTKIGILIRKTSLDELPQFINVLKGDMSIVGPRPERTVFVDQFKHQIPGYMQKHMVKAGITGWAQVNGWRGDTDLAKRIECDIWYIKNWSFFLDIRIILMTIVRVLVDARAK